MVSRIRAILNHPVGYTAVGGVLALLLWELLKLLVRALEALNLSGLQSALEWLARMLAHPIPLGYLIVLVVVFVTLFWTVRKRFDRWSTRFISREVTDLEVGLKSNRNPVRFEMRCIGWKPPTNHDVEYPIDRNSRLRFSLMQIQPAQNYTFYIRFWSEGFAPRWMGITNRTGTHYTSKNRDEVSLYETDNARPGIEIHLLELIRTRFPDFADQKAVVDRFRLRGDGANLKEVIIAIELT